MEFQNNKEIVFQKDGVLGERLGVAFGNEYVVLTLEPGSSIDKHTLPIPVSFFVVTGKGTCTLGTELIQVDKQHLLHANSGLVREWKNTGTETLTVLVIKHIPQ